FLLVGAAQCRAKDVAERSAGVCRTELGDRLLLLLDLEGLDGDGNLARLAVELRDAGIDLLACREALGTLIAALAGKLRTPDEGCPVRTDDLHLEAGVLDLGALAGDHRALLQVAGLCEGVTFELLDAEGDALLLGVDIEHHGPDHVALLVLLDHLLARTVPIE